MTAKSFIVSQLLKESERIAALRGVSADEFCKRFVFEVAFAPIRYEDYELLGGIPDVEDYRLMPLWKALKAMESLDQGGCFQ